MKKIIKKKLNSKKGFSLAELLVTIIILVLATGIVAASIPVAMNAYRAVTVKSNAELLLSTTLTEFRNEFCTAEVTDIDASTMAITYKDGETGTSSRIFNADEGLMVQRYVDSASPDAAQLLVTTQAASMKLKLKYENAVYSDGVLTISNIGVFEEDKKLAGLDEFAVRTKL